MCVYRWRLGWGKDSRLYTEQAWAINLLPSTSRNNTHIHTHLQKHTLTHTHTLRISYGTQPLQKWRKIKQMWRFLLVQGWLEFFSKSLCCFSALLSSAGLLHFSPVVSGQFLALRARVHVEKKDGGMCKNVCFFFLSSPLSIPLSILFKSLSLYLSLSLSPSLSLSLSPSFSWSVYHSHFESNVVTSGCRPHPKSSPLCWVGCPKSSPLSWLRRPDFRAWLQVAPQYAILVWMDAKPTAVPLSWDLRRHLL